MLFVANPQAQRHIIGAMKSQSAQKELLLAVRKIAIEKEWELRRMKRCRSGLRRPDFIWHYLLQSFATMGKASGAVGLIHNQENYRRVTYDALARLTPRKRREVVREVCRLAKVRMPDVKAQYILGCFDFVRHMGGPQKAKELLLAEPGRDAKIKFLRAFPGIGPKYARNIMMDVYHKEFRGSIALDVRIKSISKLLRLTFTDANYSAHESFYLEVAHMAGLNGWELDRLLFNFGDEVKKTLGSST
jgi:endonuclease III